MDPKLVPALIEAIRTHEETSRINTKALAERDRLFRQWTAMLSVGMTVKLGGARGVVTEHDDEKIVIAVGASTETLLRHNSNNAYALQPWTDADEDAHMIAERKRALLGAIEQMAGDNPLLSHLESVLAPAVQAVAVPAVDDNPKRPMNGMEGYIHHAGGGAS